MSALLFDARINSDQLNKDVARVNSTIRDMTDDIKTEGNKMEGLFAKIGAGIASYFAVGSLSNFAQEMVRVRGEFQKFEAVLTNTLDGDNVRASSLLEGLSEFAAKTPYQLQDITENFVKLANQGIVLTQQELTKLGDFAAVTGKPIGQLFEAIMDINNPERWKEFGARIQTEGEKVAISFRGQRIEFERTIEGAKNAIAQLGTMKGVEGTMEVISKTLQGQISNFQDAWDRMLNDLGKANEGTFAGLIGGATSLVQNYETVIDSIKGLVVTLGAAKAAQIVYNAVLAEQAAVNALVVQSNGFLVASDARAVLWKTRLVTAQQALNKSMLANPYVLAVAGITAMIAGLMAITKHIDQTVDAQRRFNEHSEEQNKIYEKRQTAVNKLLDTLRDEKKAEEDRLKALQDLQTLYPAIFSNLDLHSLKLSDLAIKEREVTDEIKNRTIEEQRSYVDNLKREKERLTKLKENAQSSPGAGMYRTTGEILFGYTEQKRLEQIETEIDLNEKLLQQRIDERNAQQQQIEESKKSVQQRIAEAKSIDTLGKVQEEWQNKIKLATTDTDRTKLQNELKLIDAALDRMSGKGKDKDKETPAEKVAKDLAKKREEYEAYYTAVEQMGREWADKEYALLLKQGDNYQRYLENRLKANRDNMVEVLEIVKAASSADVDMLPSLMTPIKTTGVKERDKATGKYVEPIDTKQLQQSVGNMSKLARWAAAIKNDIKEWDMEDIANGAQQTSQFFGELSYQVRDIDAGLADVLDNIGGIFSNVANIASGNILQQIAGVTGLMTQMYSMVMDTSGIEERLSKPWEEFERWIAASNRALQQYIDLRDQALGEERYSATDKVIEETRRDIADTEAKLKEMELSWTVKQDGWFGKGWDRYNRRIQEIQDSLGGLQLTQEGLARSFGALGYESYKGVFSLDLDKLLYDEMGKFSLDRVNKLITDGVITDEKVIAAVDSYNQLLKDLTSAEQEKQKLLTATLAANVTDSIVEGFRNGQRTAEEFADSFEELMRNALLNVMKVKMLEPQIARWAEDFEQAMADQLLSDSEKQSLKAEWDRIISANAAYLQGLEQTAGIVTDAAAAADTTGLAGAIKGITEETAGMIAGQMYAIREHMASLRRFQAGEQLDIMNQTVTHLAEIASNTRHNQKLNSIDDRLKDTNAYLKALL